MVNCEKRWASAFTLIELMITVSIIGILASIAIPKFADMIRQAQEGQTKGGLGALRSAIAIYYADNEGQYPNSFIIDSKYIAAIPPCRLPYYHPDNTLGLQVLVPALSGLIAYSVAHTETIGFPIWPANFYLGIAGNGACLNCDYSNVGNTWVACSHTDSKGTVWTSY